MSDLSAASPAEEAAARTVDETIAQSWSSALARRGRRWSGRVAVGSDEGFADRNASANARRRPYSEDITTHLDA